MSIPSYCRSMIGLADMTTKKLESGGPYVKTDMDVDLRSKLTVRRFFNKESVDLLLRV